MTKQKEFYKAIENNDIKSIESLIKYKSIKPATYYNWAIYSTSANGYTEITKLLLKDHRVDPTDINNRAIRSAYENNQTEILELLWNDNRVRDTLKEDNLEFYNKLSQKYLKIKLFSF